MSLWKKISCFLWHHVKSCSSTLSQRSSSRNVCFLSISVQLIQDLAETEQCCSRRLTSFIRRFYCVTYCILEQSSHSRESMLLFVLRTSAPDHSFSIQITHLTMVCIFVSLPNFQKSTVSLIFSRETQKIRQWGERNQIYLESWVWVHFVSGVFLMTVPFSFQESMSLIVSC